MGEDLYEQKFNILFVIFVSTMAIPFIPTFSENVYIKEPKPYCGSALPGKDCGQAPDTRGHLPETSYCYCSASVSISYGLYMI